MSLLKDDELIDRLNAANPMITCFPLAVQEKLDNDPFGRSSPVQPASIDLHIGEVLLPGTDDDTRDPRKQYDLPVGHSAVIVTHEILHMPNDIGCAAFPLAGRGQRGVLMMNPGHVDPGYEGKLWFSFINLSREEFRLTEGQRIATAMFWKLSDNSTAAWQARYGQMVHLDPPADAVNTIAGDALMVEHRAEEVATDIVKKEWKKSAL